MVREKPLRVGLIGFGAIGGAVYRLLRTEGAGTVVIVGALVRDPAKHAEADAPSFVTTCDDLLALKPEVVVEAAGHGALRAHGPAVLRAGCDLVMVSVGAFATPEVYDAVVTAAETGNARAIIASGAIGALDAIAAASIGGLDRVTHTTRKPAHTLLPSDEAAALTEAREVFRGNARDGALRYPESINVAAAVSLAGIGLDRTEVVVLADPHITRNMHTVVAEGAFGRLRFEIEGVPTVENPRTGRLVAMSVARALLNRRAAIVVG